jgi:methylenetetrahydrofolate reductase (NADPH)
VTADGARALAERLRHPRYEVLPLEGIEAAVLAHVPREATVTVTASPRRGLHATIEVSERLARQGYAVVPHLSARLVRDAAHLEEVLARLGVAGVRELFVPAGDAPEPAGEFSSAAALLAAMAELLLVHRAASGTRASCTSRQQPSRGS